jgi:hypothetical protein
LEVQELPYWRRVTEKLQRLLMLLTILIAINIVITGDLDWRIHQKIQFLPLNPNLTVL